MKKSLLLLAFAAAAQTPVNVSIGSLWCGAKLIDVNHVQTWCYDQEPNQPLLLVRNGITYLPLDKDATDNFQYGYDAGQITKGGICWGFHLQPDGVTVSWKYRASVSTAPDKVKNGQF